LAGGCLSAIADHSTFPLLCGPTTPAVVDAAARLFESEKQGELSACWASKPENAEVPPIVQVYNHLIEPFACPAQWLEVGKPF
jgi:hypothetical protein